MGWEAFSILEKTNDYKNVLFFQSSKHNYRTKVDIFFHASTLFTKWAIFFWQFLLVFSI